MKTTIELPDSLFAAAKAAAVKQALEGHGDPMGLPARLVRSATGTVRWLLDQEAAARLASVAEGEAG